MHSLIREVRYSQGQCGYLLDGFVPERDLLVDPDSTVIALKHAIIDSITQRIMSQLGPKIDEAISHVLTQDSQNATP